MLGLTPLGAVHTAISLVAVAAGVMAFFYVETGSYSGTFLFHMIPGITETSTRLPLGASLLANAEAPELKMVTGVLFVLFFIGATLQVRRLHTRNAALAGALVAPAP